MKRDSRAKLVEFGKRLLKVRLERGLTQLQIKDLTGISNVQIARYEKAITKPTRSIVKQLSDALDVKFEVIAGNFFEEEFSMAELDRIYQQLKSLPVEDILVMKDIMECFVGFKAMHRIIKEN